GIAGESARNVGLMTEALAKLKSLIPTIGFGAAATGLFLIGKNALTTAEHLNTLSKKTGATVEDLSALQVGGLLSSVDQSTLETGLAKLVNNISALRRGADEQTDSFAQLGL